MVELKTAITVFRAIGAATCALAMAGAVLTMLHELDLHTVPFPGDSADNCAQRDYEGKPSLVPGNYWGCRSPPETQRAVVHCVFMILGGLLIIAGESRLPVLLDYFQFVATFKGRAVCYGLMGVYSCGSLFFALGLRTVGSVALGLSFFLCFLQAVIHFKFGTQLEYDSIMAK